MSQTERNRIPVMKSIGKGEINLVEAAKVLDRSYRQTRRIWRRYLAKGDAGLVHRTRGRPGPRRKAKVFRDEVLACVRDRYPDFGPTLAAEYLAEKHGIPESQFRIETYGFTKPVDPSIVDSAEGKRMNRRVVFRLSGHRI